MQLEARAWRQKNFPEDTRTGVHQALGVCEEAGELAHHVLKDSQQIRGNEHLAGIKDSVGDIVIYLSGLCDYYGIDLQSAVMDSWAQVKQRDWVKNPETGSSTDTIQ
jgi:NTP pyrophosphatase (non-canonical NTP hydrolase)